MQLYCEKKQKFLFKDENRFKLDSPLTFPLLLFLLFPPSSFLSFPLPSSLQSAGIEMSLAVELHKFADKMNIPKMKSFLEGWIEPVYFFFFFSFSFSFSFFFHSVLIPPTISPLSFPFLPSSRLLLPTENRYD